MTPLVEQLVSLGFLAAMMYGMLKFLLRDIHTDLAGIKKEIKEMKADMQKSLTRIDHLYEIFIELLKGRK